MTPLKLYTLGGLSIVRGDQPIGSFVSRKVEALLVYLAHERREHQREWLASLLWADLPQERALGNLRTALSNLAAQLSDYLIITRQSVSLRADVDVWVDALVLLDTLNATGSTLNAPTARSLGEALTLYKGDFLTGFHLRDGENFERWRSAEAERLRVQILLAYQRLVQYALERGDLATGIPQARRALTLDPLNEEMHRQLILLLARDGQRAAALAQYETCVQLLHAELGLEPEPETIRLIERVRADELGPVAADQPKLHLPIEATPFIDRPDELRRIHERLVQPECRLLTIVGAGGMGKTRLALQAAAELAPDFRDGVYFVPLAPLQKGEFLPVEIANALGLALQSIDDPLAELTAYLADRELLLVLDNFEHLVDYADRLSTLLQRAPRVRLLVTSRLWLNLTVEWGLPIGGMAYPANCDDHGVGFAAVELFAACARRVDPSFALEQECAAVITICQRVDGMPLCIEIAAAWLRVLPARDIVEQIDLKFLTSPARGVSERHRSAEAVFDTSWKMLSTAEAAALMKLSVFKGAFDRESAAKIAGAALPILASLVEKSLIRRAENGYFSLHELLRQYAYDQLLLTSGTALEAHQAHLAYYTALTSNPDSRIHGKMQTQWLDRLESEHDNLRTALSWALELNAPAQLDLALQLGAEIWEFWLMRGHIAEGRQWLDLLLAATQGTVSKARGAATQGAGYRAWIQGDADRAEQLHLEGVSIRRAIDDKAGMGGSLSNLGIIAWNRGDFESARSYYEQALAARREANYTLGVASVLTNLALLMQDQGQYSEAISYAEEAWTLFKELNDLQGMLHVLYNMGAMHFDRGDLDQAVAVHSQALSLARDLGDKRVTGGLLMNLGVALIDQGETDQARTVLNESLALMQQLGDLQHIALIKRGLALLALREGHPRVAQVFIEESLSYLRKSQGDVYLGRALITKGETLLALGEREPALNTIHEALSILMKIKQPQPIADALYWLAYALLSGGNPQHIDRLLNAADSIAGQFDLRFPHHAPILAQIRHLSGQSAGQALAAAPSLVDDPTPRKLTGILRSIEIVLGSGLQ
ncbi:MAG: tetratricopeptide repeat protein [Chloroflexi bacterium]|uniref:AfsR/SARP family transcriptional regulator n=1 Tax=Candidatus Flexifilum breve TaxID=3140694 RepID=UPI003134B29D|nr:tetratricopeptide repeat protein [Chloroflexota bacterium]